MYGIWRKYFTPLWKKVRRFQASFIRNFTRWRSRTFVILEQKVNLIRKKVLFFLKRLIYLIWMINLYSCLRFWILTLIYRTLILDIKNGDIFFKSSHLVSHLISNPTCIFLNQYFSFLVCPVSRSNFSENRPHYLEYFFVSC